MYGKHPQKQFHDPDFVSSIQSALNAAGLAPNYLHVEVTETMILHDLNQSILKLNILKNLGISISLDDFGTGYSSLYQILQLPIDTIKIDRSFIKHLPNPKAKAIISALISVAKELDLKIIAEGIETKDQLNFMKATQWLLGQGYLFSKPLASKDSPLLPNQSLLPQLTTERALN